MTSRPRKSIAFVLLSLGVAGTLAACGSGKTAGGAAVPTFPSSVSGAPAGGGDGSAGLTPTPSSPDTTSTSAEPGGAQSVGQSGSAAGDPGRTPPQSGGKCTPSVLSGHLVAGSPGAGQRYASLVVTNTGHTSCTLYGYSGFQLLGSDGRTLPTQVSRTANPGPHQVVLTPGHTASVDLHWTAIAGPNEPQTSQCEPNPAQVAVIPPDQYSSFSVAWSFGAVCQNGRLDTSAYH